MIIIGEKINCSVPSVKRAVLDWDCDFIRALARAQAEAGADYIDCCASVPDDEASVLTRMIHCIEETVDIPLCLDSPNPDVLLETMGCCGRPGIINSVSAQGDNADRLFSAIAGTGWKAVCMLSGDRGVPGSVRERLETADALIARAKYYGIDEDSLFLDPPAEMLCLSGDGAGVALETIRELRNRYPDVHITAAVSNVSYRLPARRHLNRYFAVTAINAGADSLILDPTDEGIMGLVHASAAVLGRDEYCIEYINAYRSGIL